MDDTEPEQMSPNEEDEPLDDTHTKNIKLPKAVSLFTETPHESGYHKSTRTCLQYIREAMLHHRWKEASEYMSSYAQSLEDIAQGDVPPLMNEVYWRVGTEILHHHHQHPNSMMDAQNSFYAQMKNVGVKGYLLISLEHAFHLLVNGQIMEAHQQLSIAECWRHGKISQAQHQRIRLIQAYKGMLDYIIWCDRKSKLAVSEESGLEADPELHLYFRKASVSLMGILNSPGIWDPFILCYIDMLEFYSDLEGAEKVLTDYAYDSTFPPNPNACIYLYQFLKRHDRPENRMNVLKTLHTQVPSHELMLEYSTLLLQSDTEGCVQTALEVVLDMLDYACWKSSLAVWSHLKTTISRLKHQNGTEFQSVVSGTMATRKDWWPSYHFTSFHAQNDYAENLELMKVKSLLERKLCPGHSSYDAAVRKIYPDVSPQKKKQKRSKNDPKE